MACCLPLYLKANMKSLLIIAAGAIGIGLGIMIYNRRKTTTPIQLQPEPVLHPKKHHLTKAFSNAKKHSLN